MTGAELIAAERQRQPDEEGFDAVHDDEHDRCELATAGIGYAMFAVWRVLDPDDSPAERANPPDEIEWPWHPSWWHPTADPIPNLVKAGALIAAEIDRLQRHPKVLT